MQKYVPAFVSSAFSTIIVLFFTTLKFFGNADFEAILAHVIFGTGMPVPAHVVWPDSPSVTVMFSGFSVNCGASVEKGNENLNILHTLDYRIIAPHRLTKFLKNFPNPLFSIQPPFIHSWKFK